MAKLVSKTYGDALFAVAMEEDRLDEFFETAKDLSDILRANEEFGKLMNHPKIVKEEKIKIVEEVFGNKVLGEILSLMKLMVTKGRASEMLSVFDYFVNLVKEEKKIGKADVTTAIALNENQRKQVEEKLLETTDYQSFEMQYHVDKSIIGGMVIRIGDRVVDSSVKTKLQDLTRELRYIQV